MAQDQQSYRRAANAALAGLIVQAILAAVMAVAATAAQSPGMLAATWHLVGGLPIWIVLIVLYHQHRLERAEALEAEQLGRADATTAAIFDEHGADLNIARRRLDKLYKWGLPIVSLLVALYLIALGGGMLYSAWRTYAIASFNAPRESALAALAVRGEAAGPAILAVIALVVAFVAFLVARYEAGMTKAREWQLLRGGASYLIGNAVVCFLLAIGLAFLAFGKAPALLGLLALVVPGIMLLLGCEVLLNQLLAIYRPRRAGEVARPAFDSRFLGLLTSPKSLARAFGDALNYQFGFEVSKSWFYRLLGKAITPLVIFGLLLLVLMTSVVVVRPHEQAIITRFGRLVSTEPLGPGLHFKAPWPISRATILPTQRVYQVSVGSSRGGIPQGKALLWTNQHTAEGQEEEYLLAAPTPMPPSVLDAPAAGSSGAGGAATRPADDAAPAHSLVGGQVLVQFKVADPIKATLAAVPIGSGEEDMWRALVPIIGRVAERSVNRFFVMRDIDTLLGPGRINAHEVLREQIASELAELDLGVEIVAVSLAGVHPPSDANVATAFHEQIGVQQERQSMLEQARRYAIERLSQVAGSQERARAISQAIDDLRAEERQLAALRRPGAGATEEEIARQAQAIAAREAQIEEMLGAASGAAARTLAEAQAYRWRHAVGARAEAERFASELAAYRASPEVYRNRRYLETLARGLARSRKIVVAGKDGRVPALRLDFNKSAAGSGFLGEEE